MTGADFTQQINDAIGAHGQWKLRLRTAISTGRSEVTPMVARCDDQCAFGKWIHGPKIDPAVKTGLPFQVVKRLHAEFHQSAGTVLSLALSGDAKGAQKMLDSDYGDRSEKLVRALSKWKREVA